MSADRTTYGGGVAVLVFLLLLCIPLHPALRADMEDDIGETKGKLTPTGRVPVRITVEEKTRELILLGRTRDQVAYLEAGGSAMAQRMLTVSRIERAVFNIEIDRSNLNKAVRARNWFTAAALLMNAVRPMMYYLDLPNNNAAAPALRAGDYMMRGAGRMYREASTGEEEEQAKERYKTAHTILRYAGRADWYMGGTLANLKSTQCLRVLGKPEMAQRQLEQIREPRVGDRAFGLYWLVAAELALDRGDVRDALDAAVKSLCFENKDADSFPDALLLSARGYEEIQQWYRARDVYYEVARVFPGTDWANAAVARLRFIMDSDLTLEEEDKSIESTFFAFSEDMNLLSEELLKKREEDEADVPGEEDEDAYELVEDVFGEEREPVRP